MPLFTTLDSMRICEEIACAQSMVILSVPGIDISIAETLAKAYKRLVRRGFLTRHIPYFRYSR